MHTETDYKPNVVTMLVNYKFFIISWWWNLNLILDTILLKIPLNMHNRLDMKWINAEQIFKLFI